MNNLRLLTGLLCVALLSGKVCAVCISQRVVTLEQLFEIAETNSLQLRPSLTACEEASREVSMARSQRLPDINANLNLSYLGNGFTTNRSFSDTQKASIPHLGNGLSIDVSQPVFAGGAINAAIDLAELKSAATHFSADSQRDAIRFQLTSSYLELFKCNNLRSVVVNNIVRARKVLEEMNVRFEQGIALQNDITRYELLLSNLELQLVKIDNSLNIINHDLVVTAGIDSNTIVIPDSTILERSLPVYGEEWWQNEAIENSSALALARTGLDISRKSETLVKSEMLPKVNLQAHWTIDGPILVEVPPINRNLSYWFVGVGVNYNLASLYKSNKSVAKSKVATHVAEQRLDAVSENLGLDIRREYLHYLEAYEELKTQEKSVELASRNYHTISTRYSEGMALITDMLDAANSRLDAEQKLVNARINIIYCYYKLLFISGKI